MAVFARFRRVDDRHGGHTFGGGPGRHPHADGHLAGVGGPAGQALSIQPSAAALVAAARQGRVQGGRLHPRRHRRRKAPLQRTAAGLPARGEIQGAPDRPRHGGAPLHCPGGVRAPRRLRQGAGHAVREQPEGPGKAPGDPGQRGRGLRVRRRLRGRPADLEAGQGRHPGGRAAAHCRAGAAKPPSSATSKGRKPAWPHGCAHCACTNGPRMCCCSFRC